MACCEWRYLIVFASFIVQFITAGIQYSAGVYHMIFLDAYEDTQFVTSWVAALLLGVSILSAILGNLLSQRLGCRVTVMVGGLVAAIGFGLSFLCQELFELYITVGFIGGLGLGLAFTPSLIIVEQHFPEHRTMALGVATCGLGLGISLWPLGVHYLVEYMSWKGASLIIGGAAINICVCGAVMRSPDQYKVKPLPMFGPSTLKIPIFLVVCASYLFWSVGAALIYVHMPQFARSLGGDTEKGANLVCYIGMAVFVSRGMFRIISDVDIFTTLICSIVLGVVLTALWQEMFLHYTGIIGYCLMFGFHSGFWVSFNRQIAKDTIGVEHVARGYGYFTLLAGLGTLTAIPLGGYLVDETNNYDYIFYTAGSCILISSCLLVATKLNAYLPKKPGYDYEYVDKSVKKLKEASTRPVEKEDLLVESMITTL